MNMIRPFPNMNISHYIIDWSNCYSGQKPYYCNGKMVCWLHPINTDVPWEFMPQVPESIRSPNVATEDSDWDERFVRGKKSTLSKAATSQSPPKVTKSPNTKRSSKKSTTTRKMT